MNVWNMLQNGAYMAVGYLPAMVTENDPRPAKVQLHENYAHGGGWRKFDGFVLHNKDVNGSDLPVERWLLKYPGDPAYKPLAYTNVHGEWVIVFPSAWVMVYNCVTEEWEVARMD